MGEHDRAGVDGAAVGGGPGAAGGGAPQRGEEAGDWVLAHLLDVLSTADASTGITLLCNGALVAGTPIGESRYLELLGMAIDTTFGAAIETVMRAAAPREGEQASTERADIRRRAEAGDELRELLVEIGQALREWRSPDEPDPSGARRYVNLRRVTIKLGDDDEIDVPLWRGRLSEVSGWCWGRHGVEPYQGE